MKNVSAVLSFILVVALTIYSFYGLMPHYVEDETISATDFSVDRALIPLEKIAKAPHYLGSPAHAEVRKFLISELYKLGLQPHIQEGFSLNPDSKTLDKPINIVAKIEGTESTRSLLLLSHYDSAPVGSYGASDDGVGLVTILESLRAFIASGKRPKNDIIILFSDAEELGLDGAKLFVNEHPWAKDVGLVLNFEARGTSGPSNMILETNGGNSKLIKAFIEANPEFPVASSLMYSVYKMLPNDTDSTIFRVDGDIDSFFFAFIDSHYNYHTANDSMYFLDWNSLMHQGSYLLPLLHHFADADLSTLKSDTDDVYFNFPIVKMLHYPFSWIIPMLILAFVIFIILIGYGIAKGRLTAKGIGRGFLPLILSLLVGGLVTFFGWKAILAIYPKYQEIQQGFTYNGHYYIAFFVALSLCFTFAFYNWFLRKNQETSFFVAPISLWLIVNTAVAIILKGAAFFIIPVFFALLAFGLMLLKERWNPLIMAFLSGPAIFIIAPLIQFFPVGLGLKMLMLSSIFTVLLFGLSWPVFSHYRTKAFLSGLFFILALFFFFKAHTKSSFSVERKRPNSLVFYEDQDLNKAYWLTYDKKLDEWTRTYLGNKPERAGKYLNDAAYSKYGIKYTFATEQPVRNIPSFAVHLRKDTLIDNTREVTFTIIPNRSVNKIDLFNESGANFYHLEFNGKIAPVEDSTKTYRGTKNEALINYFVSEGDSLEVKIAIKDKALIRFRVMEYSFDLLSNPIFNIAPRPDFMMPKPFVITDAIAVKRTFEIDSIPLQKRDVGLSTKIEKELQND